MDTIYTKEELTDLIQSLTQADPTNHSPYIKMSKTNWETLGHPLQIQNREVIPVSGFPDERIYLTSTR